MLPNKLVKHFWKESLPKMVAKVGVLAGSVMNKVKKTLLQSSTFDKNEGVLLQHKLVKHCWKESLPKIIEKIGVLVGNVMQK